MSPVIFWPLNLLVAYAVVTDLRRREVPDWISITILVGALAAKVAGVLPITWVQMIAGFSLGLLLTAPLFYMDGLGGGDVKLISAIGTAIGAFGLLITLFWIAVAGMVLAAIAKFRGQDTLAYVPAIAVGLLIYSLWPEALQRILF